MARLTTILLGAVGSFLLFAASLAVPPLGFFSGILAPFPVIYGRLRYGTGTAAIVILTVITALTALFGINAGFVYALQCGVVSLLMPGLLVKGYGAARTIAWTSGCNFVLLAGAAIIYSLFSGQSIHQAISREISTSISQAVALYEKSGVKGDDLAMVKQSMTMAAGLIIRIYPSIIAVMLGLITGVNLALTRRPAAKMGYQFNISEFVTFRVPEPVIWVLIGSGFALLAGSQLITTPAINILVVTSALYFLQGLAVISAIIARQAFAGIIRVFLYMVLLLQPYVAGVVIIIGIFDLWGDFRSPRKTENL